MNEKETKNKGIFSKLFKLMHIGMISSDMFGDKITFTFNGKTEFKTSFGGII